MMKWHLCLSAVVLFVGAYFSTGNLAPYAATQNPSRMLQNKDGYLLNFDHEHFAQVDRLVGGYPQKDWENSHYLRRIAYSIFARPFTASMGFYYGGVFFNFLLLGLSFFLFLKVITPYSKEAKIWGLWLFALYPGTHYWIGLPYHHASIVGLCLAQFLLLRWLNDQTRCRLADTAKVFTSIGLLGLFYDLMPIFIVASALLLLWKKSHWTCYLALPLAVVPSAVVSFVLGLWVSTSNPNSNIFSNILFSYLSVPDWKQWLALLGQAPKLLLLNFLDSSFWALPLLALFAAAINLRKIPSLITAPMGALSLTLLGLFLFNNLAPPYEGWQMRGEWIPRIYQPIFVVLILLTMASFQASLPGWKKHSLRGLCSLALAIQAAICFGGISGNDTVAEKLYFRFYQHADDLYYGSNLEEFGRRPIGF